MSLMRVERKGLRKCLGMEDSRALSALRIARDDVKIVGPGLDGHIGGFEIVVVVPSWQKHLADRYSIPVEPEHPALAIHGHVSIDGENRDAASGGNASERLFRAWFAMGKLIASNHNGDQARDLCNGSREEVLEGSESGVKWRSTLRDGYGGDEQDESDEGQGFGKTARELPAEDSARDGGRERDPHWHLRRLGSCRHVPHGTAAVFVSPRLLVYGAIGLIYGR
jgi:hypothetical protein